MDVLLIDPVVPEALQWLNERYDLSYWPELADQPDALRRSLGQTRAVVLPADVLVSRDFLDSAPRLQLVGRLQLAGDNTDLDACQQRGVRVVQARSATVRANAEFLLYGLLMLYRRGLVSAMLGRKVSQIRMGRELAGSTVGLLGLAPVAHTLAPMLRALGVRLLGYDPAVHREAPLWRQLHIEAVPLNELLARADAVSLQVVYAARFRGWLSDNVLNHCKAGQMWVGVTRSDIFVPEALALALSDGRIDACLLDGASASFAAEGTPLHQMPNLHLTPRLGAHTREAKSRASWYLAQRIHETLSPAAAAAEQQSDFSALDALHSAGSDEPRDPHAV